MSGWSEEFAAVDWGSSARRVYVLDSAGTVVREEEDATGALTIPAERFAGEVRALRARVGDLPLLLAGMVGSSRGWMEAAYLPCPATLPDLAQHLLWAEPGRTAIVPGISLIDDGRGDVMRGEEVQLVGAQLLQPVQRDRLICHPGTHTKWVAMHGGAITRFRTVMTGELFALLRRHSSLAEMMTSEAMAGTAFRRGVDHGFAGAVLGAALFSIRAGVLLGAMERADAPSYASGLLIGSDLRAGLADAPPDAEILVLGRGSLTRLYAAAIEQCGHRAGEMDGAAAFVAGMRAIAAQIAVTSPPLRS